MKKLYYKVGTILLLFVFLFSGICWLYAGQILDQFIRPGIEKTTTQLFEAQVEIKQLVWTGGQLKILGLSIKSPQQFQVTFPQVDLKFTLSNLWHRQLDALQISGAQIEVFQSQRQRETTETALKIPDQLPLTITKLTLTDGLLLINRSDQQCQLRELNFSGTLQQNSTFTLSAFFGPDDNYPLDITGAVELSQQQTLTIKNFSWQEQQFITEPLQIVLAGANFTLDRTILHLEHFDHSKLQGILTALGQPMLLPEALTFSLVDADLIFALQNQTINLEFQVAKGLIGWKHLVGSLTQINVVIDQEQQGWQIAGQFHGPAQATFDFNATIDQNNNLLGKARVDIPDPGHLKAEIVGGATLGISGGLHLAAEYSLRGDRFQLTTAIDGTPAKRKDNDFLDISKFDGQGNLLLSDGKKEFSFDLQLNSRPFFRADGNFQNLNFSLTAADLHEIKELFAPTQLPAQIQGLKQLKVAGQFSRKATDWTGDINLTAAEIALPDLTLNQLLANGKLSLNSDQLSLKETAANFTLAYNDELSTQVTIRGAGEFSPQKFSMVMQELSLLHINYMSADGQTGVGEAKIQLQGNIHGPWTEGPIALDLHGTIAAQEVLAGTLYADLSPYQGHFSIVGDFISKRKELSSAVIKFNISQLGALTATGQINPQELQIQGGIETVDLKTSYGKHIGPLLSELKPTLADLSLKGKISLDYRLHWNPAGWQTNGALKLRDVDVDWKQQKLQIVAGNGSIPFALSVGEAPNEAISNLESSGEISFSSLSAGLATLERSSLKLVAADNQFTLLSPLQLQMADGQMAIENLTLQWPDSKPQGSAKINITDVNLETLTQELGLPVMQGQLSADLGTLNYTDQQLSTAGLVSIEVFDGLFQLRNMHYSAPFSRYPTFYTDVDFSGLDLLQATRTFDFGEINGVVDGHIYGLKLFGTTPAAFEAVVATRDQGKRNISVKALNNLSVISQGGMTAALSRGIYRFIDFYRFQKIGFKCALDNDTFTLLGTALPGSNRYLVHGGLLPPKIDITTTTPIISFKEMMTRLSRIDRAGN